MSCTAKRTTTPSNASTAPALKNARSYGDGKTRPVIAIGIAHPRKKEALIWGRNFNLTAALISACIVLLGLGSDPGMLLSIASFSGPKKVIEYHQAKRDQVGSGKSSG